MTVSAATRKSIKKYFGLGGLFAVGNNGPFTMHDIDEDLFPAVWSYIAECLETEVELSRLVIEEISIFISKKNACPICINAHTLLEEAAKVTNDENVQVSQQAKAYVEMLYEATKNDTPLPDVTELQKMFPDLNQTTRAEVALVLVVYQYMNRVVRAILGEHVSVAMFGVPRPVAKVVESDSGFFFFKKVLRPFLSKGMRKKNLPGITRNLFREGDDYSLPEHLKGAELGGTERARALSRLYFLVDKLYKKRVMAIVPPTMIEILDDPANRPPTDLQTNLTNWALIHMRHKVINPHFEKPVDQAVAQVLLLVDIQPDTVVRCTCWTEVVKAYGEEEARMLVFWNALRCAVGKQAKGLSFVAPTDSADAATVSLSDSDSD